MVGAEIGGAGEVEKEVGHTKAPSRKKPLKDFGLNVFLTLAVSLQVSDP